MLDRVRVSGKDWKNGYSIDDLCTYTCRILTEMFSWRSYHSYECKSFKYQTVHCLDTTFYLYDTGILKLAKIRSLTSITKGTVSFAKYLWATLVLCTKKQFLIVVLVQILVKKDRTPYLSVNDCTEKDIDFVVKLHSIQSTLIHKTLLWLHITYQRFGIFWSSIIIYTVNVQ